MPIQFKSERIASEWDALDTVNPRLKKVVYLLSDYCELEFKKPLVITCIERTEAENADLYKETGKQPDWRPHTKKLALDLRASIYTESEIQRMLTFLNLFVVFGGQRKCGVYHKIAGNVLHFHVQVNPAATQS